VTRQGIQYLSSRENVEADQKNIVGKKHESREDISPFALAKHVVSKIAWESSIDQYERKKSEAGNIHAQKRSVSTHRYP
jgi:hypothetical protein